MSTTPVLVPVNLVSQFLANEKISSRHWLQCQMECLLDQVFDQLSTKFEDYLAHVSNAITGTAHHTTIDSGAIQHQLRHEPSFQTYFHHQFQATAHQLINTEFPVAVAQSQNEVYRCDDNLIDSNGQGNPDEIVSGALDQTTYGKPQHLSVTTINRELLNKSDANHEYSLDKDDQSLDEDINDNNAQEDSDKPKCKEEFDDTNNQLIITTDQMGLSLSAAHSNEQSNHNLTNEDDCDCDDCRNGIEVKEEEVEDDDDDVQIIEDIDGSSLPRKKPRMDTTQPNYEQSPVTKQSSRLVSRNQTVQVQSNNEQIEQIEEEEETNDVHSQDKPFTTLRVQCLQTGCSLMFNNKIELNHHMSTQHGILPHRCFVKDCKQSFSNTYNLSEHIKQVHANTTQWHCDHCSKHFHTYKVLSMHNHQYHQLGQYKCTFSNCAFVGEHRRKMYDHHIHQHTPTDELVCQHPNCGRQFSGKANFERHKRVHQDIKPYLCKWPSCGYVSSFRSNTIAHIKNKHLKHCSTEASLADPRDYIEVLRDI